MYKISKTFYPKTLKLVWAKDNEFYFEFDDDLANEDLLLELGLDEESEWCYDLVGDTSSSDPTRVIALGVSSPQSSVIVWLDLGQVDPNLIAHLETAIAAELSNNY